MRNRNEPWKIHSTREILKTPIFNVHVDHSECPRTGVKGDFYRFKFGDWVNIVAVTAKNEIVMIRQFRHGNKKWELEIPGGLIDNTDADPLFAGQRELFEETGFKGENARTIGSLCPNPALQDNTCHTILVDHAVKVSEPEMEKCEDIETVLLPVIEVKRLIRDRKIKHGLVLNALHFYLDEI